MTETKLTRLAVVTALPLLVAAGVALLLTTHLSQPKAEPAARLPAKIPTPTAPGFPSPPSGAVVFSRQDGENVVALALTRTPDGRQLTLQTSVVGPDGTGVSALPVMFAVGATAGLVGLVRAAPCGPGCYFGTVAGGVPRRVTVMVGRGNAHRHLQFELPSVWPPAVATSLIRRAGRVWRDLRTVVWHERLASGHHRQAVNTVWRAAAPNRFSYRIAGGAEAVVIGNRRWDRKSPTDRWHRSSQQPPLRQPIPFWSGVRNARIIGSPTVRGRRAWRITFFDPHSPAWFSVVLDRRRLRTLELDMATTAHFMHHVYSGFNEPLQVRPPQSVSRRS